MALRRYRYRMQHTWLTSQDFGYINPIFCQEVTPGDTWGGSSTILVRMAPIDRPVFLQIAINVHFFFVPHRITWEGFEDFITGKTDNSQYPRIDRTQVVTPHYLPAHFGMGKPTAETNGEYSVNALPIRAYNRVYNQFYVDQNIQPLLSIDNLTLARSNFPTSDYFSAFRTSVQQGEPEKVSVSNNAFDVTDVRNALHRQRFKERRSQFGERYTDYLQALGLRVPDSRLDRPEHVAMGRGQLGISEVVATATSANENTGSYRGHGITAFRVRFPKRNFLEHGTLIGLMNMRPRNLMRHRTDKHFLLGHKDDYYQPEFRADTQEAIRKGEIKSDVTNATYLDIVGYLPRDHWLRSARDTVAGLMMTDDALQSWHGARDFVSFPAATELIRIPNYYNIFQDQASTAARFFVYADHHISKRSIVPPSPK